MHFSSHHENVSRGIFVPLCVAESEDALLKMSVPHTDSTTPALPDFSRMTEDEQIAYALQMSMQGAGAGYTWIFRFYILCNQRINELEYELSLRTHPINNRKSRIHSLYIKILLY